MKFFIDTADINEIKEAHSLGVIDGVTTNPSLIARTGRKFEEVVRDICNEIDGPISLEVIGLDAPTMIKEGKELAKINKNVVVKIPIMTEGLKATKELSAEGVNVNMTLIFSPSQALLAAKAGARYVSPFVGRLDDISHVGMDIVADIMDIYENYSFDTEVIVASIRNPLHVLDAAQMGAHIATIPLSVIKQLSHHPLTDKGIEKFLEDWKKVPGN